MQPVVVAAGPPDLIYAFGSGAMVLNRKICRDLEQRRRRVRAVQIDQFIQRRQSIAKRDAVHLKAAATRSRAARLWRLWEFFVWRRSVLCGARNRAGRCR